MSMRATVFGALLLLLASVGEARALTVDLEPLLRGERIAAQVSLLDVAARGGRCHVDVSLVAPRLWRDLDARIRGRGNLGSSRNRFYWVGPTRLSGVGEGNRIRLASRARYESWTVFEVFGKKVKTRNFRDTKTVDFALRPEWDADADSLTLAYEILNIRNFPGGIEKRLRRFGIDFGGTARFSVPRDDDTLRALDPRIETSPTFAATEDGAGLSIRTTVSLTLPPVELFLGLEIDSCAAMQIALDTLPDKAAALVVALIARL